MAVELSRPIHTDPGQSLQFINPGPLGIGQNPNQSINPPTRSMMTHGYQGYRGNGYTGLERGILTIAEVFDSIRRNYYNYR